MEINERRETTRKDTSSCGSNCAVLHFLTWLYASIGARTVRQDIVYN